MKRKQEISTKTVTVQVVRRQLLAPALGLGEARHDYTVLFTTRAEVRSSGGTKEWGEVEINGQKATHIFTIRYTTIAFDVRERIRDARGKLYQILSVDNVDLGNRELKIMAAYQGAETAPAAT